uniref:CLK4-associating serine/arginine rich protein n=1 Tax=Salarias fasciatus TaxID=181472 RepID=A0A672FR38_SALFA
MWQEARKHERKLRGMMVATNAEKKDPAQFLQVHGRAYKIHLDPAVALAAESPVNMMPGQGDANNMIDRFDVRAHLDYIPTYTPPLLTTSAGDGGEKCNYERYRGLVQNDFANISEEQCLYQIYLDELYGGLPKPNEDEKKKLAEKKATIGYTYEDSTVTEPDALSDKDEDNSENSESEEDEGIPDIDVEVDVDELNQEQVLDLNKIATPYGMADGDFVRMLRKDKEEVEAIKHAKALEAEKAMYSGRRSRRQRREFREKRLKGRQISPPSYARRRDSPTYDPYKRPESESSSESRSRSRTPGPEKITFITSFGGSDDEAAAAAAAAAQAAAPHSGHAPSTLQHSAGHSRGSGRRAGEDPAAGHKETLLSLNLPLFAVCFFFFLQEREGELRAMARKIRMKSGERREKERDEWERQYGRQSHSPSPSKYGREHNSYRRYVRSRKHLRCVRGAE